MATIINKQKVVTGLFNLGKGHRPEAMPERPVLEQFVYAVLREDATRAAADRAYRAVAERFYDWNELRVSSEEEVAEVLVGLPGAGDRARRIREFLQEVFETTFSFDLEPLQKKGFKQAGKQLARFAAANDYAVAWVVQQSLGGHAIPLDGQSTRVLKRIGLLDEQTDNIEAMRASLEHQIPKAKGAQFVDLVSDLADTACFESDPACPDCPLHHCCPTGALPRPAAAPAASKKPR
jgi:endonuclease III